MSTQLAAVKRDSWGEITLYGDADVTVARELERSAGEMLRRGVVAAVVDILASDFVDAAFLQSLYGVRDRCREVGGTVIVVADRAAARRVLDLAHEIDPLTIAGSLEEGRALARALAADATG